MTRCGVWERPVDHDWDPFYVANDPGYYVDERFEVAMGNHSEIRGEAVDYLAILHDAIRNARCAECGSELPHYVSLGSGMTRAAFCSEKHFYAFRDRRRYAENRQALLERARRYYAEHREEILEKAAARRGKTRPPGQTHCSECGNELAGRQRVTCGRSSCRDRRFKRTNPEAYAERERQKVERRRERRRAAREGSSE